MHGDDTLAVRVVDLLGAQRIARVTVEEMHVVAVEQIVTAAQHRVAVGFVWHDGQEGKHDGPPGEIGEIETTGAFKLVDQLGATRVQQGEHATLAPVANRRLFGDQSRFDEPIGRRINRAVAEFARVPLQLLHLLAQLVAAHGTLRKEPQNHHLNQAHDCPS